METSPNRRRPPVPEPIEDDPFEMDWPWPGCTLPEAEAPVEPPVARPEEAVEEHSPIEGGSQ